MNTHNQACIAKLEFGEPSQSYNGNYYIEMMYHAFNLSRLEIKQETEVTQEDVFWNIRNITIIGNTTIVAGLGGFSLGAVAFVLWARRPFKGN